MMTPCSMRPTMMAFFTYIISVVVTPMPLVVAIAPSTRSIGIRGRHDDHRHSLLGQSSNASNHDNDNDDVLFDPFLQSPLSFGEPLSLISDHDFGDDVDSREFGFQSIHGSSSLACEITTNISLEIEDAFEFDPLLSPHAYAKGIAAGPVISPSSTTPLHTTNSRFKLQQSRIGILLIDHGSKRPASNEHIHYVARMYEDRLNIMASTALDSKLTGSIITSPSQSTTKTVVRAAHMEIASPSIIDSLRNLFASDQVAKVICVPYFLSPGRHATEDVPNLINEARRMLIDEGVISLTDETSTENSILVSDALGTQLECMLRGVDELVENTLRFQ